MKNEKVYNDWRLPTLEELSTLVDYTTFTPASFDKSMKNECYWSSTAYAPNSSNAWLVYFNGGYTNNHHKSLNYYVRFVRDGMDGLEWSEDASERMNWDKAMKYSKNLVAPVNFVKDKR